jgi:hypothetical protein
MEQQRRHTRWLQTVRERHCQFRLTPIWFATTTLSQRIPSSTRTIDFEIKKNSWALPCSNQLYASGMRSIPADHPDRRVLHTLWCIAFPECISSKLWLQIRKSSLVELTCVCTKDGHKSSLRSCSQVMARLQHHYYVSVRMLRSPSSPSFPAYLRVLRDKHKKTSSAYKRPPSVISGNRLLPCKWASATSL